MESVFLAVVNGLFWLAGKLVYGGYVLVGVTIERTRRLGTRPEPDGGTRANEAVPTLPLAEGRGA